MIDMMIFLLLCQLVDEKIEEADTKETGWMGRERAKE
jgi:hypothetical protein